MSTLLSTIRHGGSPLMRKGAILIVVTAAVLVALGLKNEIKVALRGGESLSAEFADADGLVENKSKVKLAGLQVGVVTDIEHRKDGSALVTMKVDKPATKGIGSAPSARITPLTILGGEYSVELSNGGAGEFNGAKIPLKRTGTPVELDRILEALPSETRKSTRSLVQGLSGTFDRQGRQSVRDIADIAPPVLRGSTTLLTAAQGTEPDRDLQGIVTYLQSAAAVLEAQANDVGGALTGLDTTSAALAQSRSSIGQTVDLLPTTLDDADRGLGELEVTVKKLGRTADGLRPTAREARKLVAELDPFVRDARPVVAKLGPITRDAIPTVRRLIPTVQSADGFIDDIDGKTIKRVRGPILNKLAKPWSGKAAGTPEYDMSGTGIQKNNKFYEEIAFMVLNLGRSVITQDQQGSVLNFQAGVSPGSVAGIPLDEAIPTLSLEQALANLVSQLGKD